MKTKIICTIGPSTQSSAMIHQLIEGGMNIARLNFSHGTYEFHKDAIRKIRDISKELGKNVEILCDLQGPKIRVGEIANEPRKLIDGEKVTLVTPDSKDIGADDIVILDPYLHSDVEPNDIILMDDGNIELKVKEINGFKIVCDILVGGNLYSHKGVNLPLTKTTTSSITEKDEKDLEFIKTQKPDWVAISFVQRVADIEKVRNLADGMHVKIMSKIERALAMDNLDEIIDNSDGVMVARGDLGVEMPIEKLPFAQKNIIRKCNQKNKFVVTATQMLASMTQAPYPTRAEATDIANAVLDGTNALMLSNETAVGKYPIAAFNTMIKIAKEAEGYQNKISCTITD